MRSATLYSPLPRHLVALAKTPSDFRDPPKTARPSRMLRALPQCARDIKNPSLLMKISLIFRPTEIRPRLNYPFVVGAKSKKNSPVIISLSVKPTENSPPEIPRRRRALGDIQTVGAPQPLRPERERRKLIRMPSAILFPLNSTGSGARRVHTNIRGCYIIAHVTEAPFPRLRAASIFPGPRLPALAASPSPHSLSCQDFPVPCTFRLCHCRCPSIHRLYLRRSSISTGPSLAALRSAFIYCPIPGHAAFVIFPQHHSSAIVRFYYRRRERTNHEHLRKIVLG